MKKVLILSLSVFLFACGKSTEPLQEDTHTSLHIQFKTLYENSELEKDKKIYQNVHGEDFSVSLFRYYLSHITLVKDDGTEINMEDYNLVDAFDENYQSTSLKFPNGHYKELKFKFGVPQPQNGELSYEGDLNISNGKGMSWSWNFGYIFYKHEGAFTKTNGDNGQISLHLGTDRACREVLLPIDYTLDGGTRDVDILLDMKKIYHQAGTEKLEDHSMRHSTDVDDKSWISTFSQDIANSFDVKL